MGAVERENWCELSRKFGVKIGLGVTQKKGGADNNSEQHNGLSVCRKSEPLHSLTKLSFCLKDSFLLF